MAVSFLLVNIYKPLAMRASSIRVGGTRTFSNLMTPLTLFNEAP